jgi:hypothetical protein
MKNLNPEHPQVPFTTLYGEQVEVDEGLLEILEILKRFGVVTLASCQNNGGQSYISALRPGMKQFLKKMLSNYESKGYSEEVCELIKGFDTGFKLLDISIFRNEGTVQFPLFTSAKGVYDQHGYQIEYYFRNDELPGVVIRWPYEQTEIFLRMLQEMRA